MPPPYLFLPLSHTPSLSSWCVDALMVWCQYESALDKLQKKYTEAMAQLDREQERAYSNKALLNSREARYGQQQRLIEELQAELRKLRKSETAASSLLAEERQNSSRTQSRLKDALDVASTTQDDARRLNKEIRTLRVRVEAVGSSVPLLLAPLRRRRPDLSHLVDLAPTGATSRRTGTQRSFARPDGRLARPSAAHARPGSAAGG